MEPAEPFGDVANNVPEPVVAETVNVLVEIAPVPPAVYASWLS